MRTSTARQAMYAAGSALGTVFLVVLVASPRTGRAAPPQKKTLPPVAADDVKYARDIAPLLTERCSQCHGAAKQESGFRVDQRAALLKGGDSGEPAIVPGHSDKSRLVLFVAHLDPDTIMPPQGAALTDKQVGMLRAWIDHGADMPASAAAPPGPPPLWSLQPVKPLAPPAVKDAWIKGPIDTFILQKLHEEKLQPSPAADRVSLIRRVYLDVIGLPPTPEQIDHFVHDPDPRAYEHIVDELLDSPRYGERWARHWLDVVRFAETDGFEENGDRPNAYRYRDYLIRALNEDRPWDEMIVDQLAGDTDGEDAATGFIVGGPADRVTSPNVLLSRTQRQDELADMVSTTSTAFMGLTVGCAKCHDHKFDPIPQRDYYCLQAVFAGVRHSDRPARKPKVKKAKAVKAIAGISATEKSAAAKPPDDKPFSVYAGRFEQPGPTFRLNRGDPMQPREQVVAEALTALRPMLGSLDMKADSPEQQRRLALAHWIARPDNPLTARVIVNRLWHYHFGAGIVASPSDFGHMGTPPTHPELLDWLAGELVREGWRLKSIHRLILLSNTYQQTSAPNPAALAADANCRWLWRYPPRRLEAEAIRDSILQSSGVLDLTMFGPGFSAFEPNSNYVRVYKPKETWGPPEWRRMVYMTKVRREHDPVFGAFDAPDAGQVCPKRSRSTTPIQAFNMLNSGFMVQQGNLLAARVEHESGTKTADRIRRAFEIALGRAPRSDEAQVGAKLVEQFGLGSLCRALYNTNEFLFIP